MKQCALHGACFSVHTFLNFHRPFASNPKNSPFNKINKCTLFSAMDPLLPLSGLEKGTTSGVGAVPPAVAVKGTLA
jgi:hypothetical protein